VCVCVCVCGVCARLHFFPVVIHTHGLNLQGKAGEDKIRRERISWAPTLFFVVFCSQLAPSQN